MRRIGMILLTLVMVAASVGPTHAQTPTPLRAEGSRLLYGAQEVKLVGTNFDNISSLGAGIGTGRVSDVRYVEADYRLLRSHGANHVRFGLSFNWYKDTPAAFWAMTDAQVRHARAAGMWIVWNMFTTPGNCYEGYGNHCPFWSSGSEQSQLTAFWVAMAQRYATEPAVAGYDLLNEPTPPGPGWCSTWWSVAGAMVKTVRLHTEQLIFLNTCDDPGGSLLAGNLPRGRNLVYEVHDYGPIGLSHGFDNGAVYPSVVSEQWWNGSCLANKAAFAGNGTGSACWPLDIRQHYGLNWAAQENVPIYIGEWGSTSRLTGYAQYHQDKAELYRDWGVSHAHYTWQHQTIRTGGYYQWGIVANGSQVIDDPAKLNAVKIAWVGNYQPTFDGTPPPTAPPTPQPPGDVTATPASPTASPSATSAVTTPTRTPNATQVARTATAQARQTASAQPATAVPPTAVPAAGGLGVTLEAGAVVVTVPAAGGVLISTWPEMPAGTTLPAGCSSQGMSVWCWGAQPGVLRLPWAAEAAVVRQGRSVVAVSR